MDAILAFDYNVVLMVQEYLRFDWLTPVMIGITYFAEEGIGWIVLGVFLLFFKKTRRGGMIMLFCLLGAWLVNDFVLKELFQRVRPYDAIEQLQQLGPPQSSASFPSGHTNASFACAFALTMVFGCKGSWSYLLALLIGLSRIYLGMHYPTDVLGGMLVGTIMSYLVYMLIVFIEFRRGRQLFVPKDKTKGAKAKTETATENQETPITEPDLFEVPTEPDLFETPTEAETEAEPDMLPETGPETPPEAENT